jgi:hypothetical protein
MYISFILFKNRIELHVSFVIDTFITDELEMERQ